MGSPRLSRPLDPLVPLVMNRSFALLCLVSLGGLASVGAMALPAATPAATPADECEECGDRKICKPHKSHDLAELKRLAPDLKSEDVDKRLRALEAVADLATDHANAPFKGAAEVLVEALEDDKLVVQAAAFRYLSDGQHPETSVVGYVKRIKWFKGHMWTLVADMTGPNEEHGGVGDAMDVLKRAVSCGEDLRDDRVVDALSGLLNAFPTEMRGEPVAMAASRALLSLGTVDAAKTVIKQFGALDDASKMRQVHFALVTFGNRLEIEEMPEFSENVESAWTVWLRKNQKLVPKKLGKWTGPPKDDEDE